MDINGENSTVHRPIEKNISRDFDTISVTLDGDSFNKVNTAELCVQSPVISLNGKGRISKLEYDESMLSKHIMMLGGIGTGKTNTFNHMIEQVLSKLKDEDIVVIFDTKGDYLDNFGSIVQDKIIISNDDRATDNYWNIFGEIDKDSISDDSREIATALFRKSIDDSNSPFFPSAARDIFCGLLKVFKELSVNTETQITNKVLMDIIRTSNVDDIRKLLGSTPELKAMADSYIGSNSSGQTQGVISELHSVLNSIFVNNFCKDGLLSLSDIIRNRTVPGKGKKVIFIEYDLRTGEVLTPIYSLMVDLILKEALSNRGGENKGSIYLFIDEFKLLPHLTHMEDAVNFGRSFGIKAIIAMQSITQVYDAYGEYKAKSMLSGFLNCICFNVNNKESREFIRDRFGDCIRQIRYSQQASLGEYVFTDKVVKDKNITRLETGSAIVGVGNKPPFIFKFEQWVPVKERR